MTQFKIGELVVMQYATYFHEYDGALAVITDMLNWRDALDLNTMQNHSFRAYGIQVLRMPECLLPEGKSLVAAPYQLRRLGEPAEDLESIEDSLEFASE